VTDVYRPARSRSRSRPVRVEPELLEAIERVLKAHTAAIRR
jgi:hypothetical protein